MTSQILPGWFPAAHFFSLHIRHEKRILLRFFVSGLGRGAVTSAFPSTEDVIDSLGISSGSTIILPASGIQGSMMNERMGPVSFYVLQR
jgi:hypothetical protein